MAVTAAAGMGAQDYLCGLEPLLPGHGGRIALVIEPGKILAVHLDREVLAPEDGLRRQGGKGRDACSRLLRGLARSGLAWLGRRRIGLELPRVEPEGLE